MSSDFKQEGVPSDFRSPTALPKDAQQAQDWQEANRAWWERNPMRYDWTAELHCDEFSPEFYREIDQRFFASAREYMPWKIIPFDSLIDFDALKNMDVLEVGVGNGSHAQLLATHARSFSGIDITEYASRSTSNRVKLLNLECRIERMDAERMQFEDESFDFIWSWGVIHHSSNPRRIIQEMHRVLRPGCRATIMVYHRSWWIYYFVRGFIRGVLLGELWRTGSLSLVAQRGTDGALARFYRRSEWRELVSPPFAVEGIWIYGPKNTLVPLPRGKVKDVLVPALPNPLTRFLTNTCRMGMLLVSTIRKRE